MSFFGSPEIKSWRSAKTEEEVGAGDDRSGSRLVSRLWWWLGRGVNIRMCRR